MPGFTLQDLQNADKDSIIRSRPSFGYYSLFKRVLNGKSGLFWDEIERTPVGTGLRQFGSQDLLNVLVNPEWEIYIYKTGQSSYISIVNPYGQAISKIAANAASNNTDVGGKTNISLTKSSHIHTCKPIPLFTSICCAICGKDLRSDLGNQ